MKQKLPRLLIGAAGSGSGKTTFTCGLLKALSNMGKNVISFKCGPDYIDPMFHKEVLHIPSRNLDLFFTGEDTTRYLLGRHGNQAELAVIEGVMGYYDGLAGISSEAGSYDLAVKTQTPAILLVDGRGKSVSLLAEIKGFLEFKKDSGIQGVILNRVSPMMYWDLKGLIEETLPVQVFGYLPKMDDCSLESRHLGLVTAGEIKNLQSMVDKLAAQIAQTVDLKKLILLSQTAPELDYQPLAVKKQTQSKVRIGVAMDQAFCFYYQDNLDLLKDLGAEIVYFSPIEDKTLPEHLGGLVFGGGYPELYLEQLAQNYKMKEQIHSAVCGGMPCIAECGGYMYLHDEIEDAQGQSFAMAGIIEGRCFPTNKLSRFGYITLTASEDTFLCNKGEQLRGHEFHYWDSTNTGDSFLAKKPLRKRNWNCIVSRDNLFAGYPHIHFYSNPLLASRFVRACAIYAVG